MDAGCFPYRFHLPDQGRRLREFAGQQVVTGVNTAQTGSPTVTGGFGVPGGGFGGGTFQGGNGRRGIGN